MGKQFEDISPEINEWVSRQRIFFVSTAPLAAEGLLNCSPKGMDTFRILGPREVAYLDLTGSGIETAAHLSENGRIVFMFCAFSGPPRIVRFHGVGRFHPPGSRAFQDVIDLFPALPGARGIVRAQVTRIADSCGYSVPRYEFVEDRDTLVRWATAKGETALQRYRSEHNARSIDGLPGLAGTAGMFQPVARVVPLRQYPEHCEFLAREFEREWPSWYGPGGRGDATADLLAFANPRGDLPAAVIALGAEGQALGIAALKAVSIPSHAHLAPWATAGFVLPAWRRRGIGALLLEALLLEASRLGYGCVYCATGTAVSLLVREGWSHFESVIHEGQALELFRRELPRK